MSEANCRSAPRYLGYMGVQAWEHIIVKIESIL